MNKTLTQHILFIFLLSLVYDYLSQAFGTSAWAGFFGRSVPIGVNSLENTFETLTRTCMGSSL